MNHSKKIVADLNAQEARMTTVRKALADILGTTESPLSIPEITLVLRRKGVLANKTTLYRELRYFVASKIAREIDLGDGKKRYEHEHTDDHHHLVCTNCEKIEKVQVAHDFGDQIQRVEKSTGFKVRNHSLEFFGLCNRCVTK